jgi:hypothetical protein
VVVGFEEGVLRGGLGDEGDEHRRWRGRIPRRCEGETEENIQHLASNTRDFNMDIISSASMGWS